jgi:integrase
MRVDDELIRLQWEPGEGEWPYVDNKAGEIVVRRSRGKHSRRIPINPDARQALNSIKGSHEEPVFLYDGKPLSRFPRHTWERAKQRALETLEKDPKRRAKRSLGRCSPHSMRHTFCTRLGRHVGNGKVSTKDAMAITGHRSYNVFERYLHSTKESRQWAVDQLCTREDDGLVRPERDENSGLATA